MKRLTKTERSTLENWLWLYEAGVKRGIEMAELRYVIEPPVLDYADLAASALDTMNRADSSKKVDR